MLVHVLDLSPLDGSDPVDNYETIEHELAQYDPRLAALPRLLVLSKADLVTPADAAAAAAEWRARLGGGAGDDEASGATGVPVIVTSSARGGHRRAGARAAPAC